jgi:arylsulfatase A-like enzyme
MSDSTLDQRWPWLLGAATIVVVFLLATIEQIESGSAPVDPRPVGTADDIARLRERDDVNVLFILIDTLRSDRLGSYGYGRDTSPYLDGLASTGVRFDRHLSQSSWTKASMTSLWTSVYPWRTGVIQFDQIVPEDAEMPAEILKRAGFDTIGLFRNGWVAPTFGFQQGFDIYNRPPHTRLNPGVLVKNPTLRQRGTDEDLTASAIEFFRVHQGNRWFLYLHLMDVHEYTFDEESALFGDAYSDVYDNSIRWVDGTLKIMMEHLVDQGYADNTLVFVTSDHGEAFSERGYEGHGRWLYRETTEVPFILSFPFKLESKVVVKTRSQNVDVWPTIFELIGVDPPAEQDGRSLVPEIMAAARGEPPPRKERVGYSHLNQNWGQRHRDELRTVALVEGPLRYIRGTIGKDPIERLFDAASDPKELEDLAKSHPETLARLRDLMDDQLGNEELAFGEVPTREIGEMELNQLRAIGYDVGD